MGTPTKQKISSIKALMDITVIVTCTNSIQFKIKSSRISVRSLLEIIDVKVVMSVYITYGRGEINITLRIGPSKEISQ